MFWLPALSLILCLAGPSFGAPPVDADPVIAPAGLLPCEEILIPAGAFLMGQPGSEGDCPAHEVSLDAFYLDKYEVTNGQYLEFCRQTDRALPEFWGQDRYRATEDYLDHPVIGVSWRDAQAYAAWAGKRLPTEAEFEYAARAGSTGSFAWGDELFPANCNYAKSGYGAPVAVGSYPPNAFGLHDMAGNVAEWVGDRYDYDYYRHAPALNPQGPDRGRFRVIRGGGWHTGPGCMRIYWRNALPNNWVDFSVGFRCARSVDPAASSQD